MNEWKIRHARGAVGQGKKKQHRTTTLRKFPMPHRVRWGEEINERTIDEHGYTAGLANKPIYCNPTKGDLARERWVLAYRLGKLARRRMLRERRRESVA